MSEQSILCPNCGHEFALNEAFTEHFEEEKRKAVKQAVENAKKRAKEEQDQLLAEIEEERGDMLKKLEAQAEEKYKLELKAKDEEMRRIQKQLEALEKRTRQGSMELQGEALETHLKAELEIAFPLDTIEDVKKGQSGGDLIHTVMNARGQRCGVIVWETKNTKNWMNNWLGKLKDDTANVNAQVSVIVSVALPDGVSTFELIDGVWVCSVNAAVALAKVLRQNLLHANNLQQAMKGMDGKMETVYIYLTSTTFRDRIQRIVDTWQSLQDQVTREERAMQSQWKERRKQLDVMIDVTTEMYTDISAIIGGEMPQVPGLTLEALPEGELDTEE